MGMITREQAVKELREMYEAAAYCEERYNRIATSQHGYIGRQSALDDMVSDSTAYADRIRELEAFLSAAS